MTVAVHHRVDGPAEAPVLLLSGSLGSTLAMWDPQLPELARHFRVVRYDHRGHGRSPVPEGPYEIGDLAGDALGLLDRLGVECAHVCGLSLGGMVAMAMASAAPGRVERLALCCTSARLGPPETWAERAATVRSEGAGAVAEAVVGRWLTPAFAAEHPDLVAELQAMVASTPAAGYAACCGAIERMDLEPRLSSIRAPTLVISAAEDPSTPPEHGARIAAAVPGARLVLLEDAAHLANVQQPGAVTGLLLEHLV